MKRHSAILLKHHLSSIAVCDEIKPDMFDINHDMPTDAAVSFCSTRAALTVFRAILPKTRSEGSQRNVLALFRLHDDI